METSATLEALALKAIRERIVELQYVEAVLLTGAAADGVTRAVGGPGERPQPYEEIPKERKHKTSKGFPEDMFRAGDRREIARWFFNNPGPHKVDFVADAMRLPNRKIFQACDGLKTRGILKHVDKLTYAWKGD